MAKGSRASKGRGPTRRERREAAARAREQGREPGGGGSSERLSKRKQRAAANLIRQAERRERRQRSKRHGAGWVRRLGGSRVLYGGVLALAGLLTLAIGVGWWLAEQPPTWWSEVDAGSAEVERTSRAVENWAVSTMTRAYPDGERWAVTLTEEDANAWLAVRLPMWVISERGSWPEGIRRVRVRFHDGRIVLGADIRESDAGEPRVVAAALRLELDRDGMADLSVDWTQINRLKLPGALGVNRLGEWLDGAGEDAIASQLSALIRGELEADTLDWRLEDGRRVTVHAVRVESGRVHLTCSTASASASASR
jgi:hypothetical protein